MKHIFVDLDGTLLLDFSVIKDEDIAALQKAVALGHHVSIATGRLDYEIKAFMERIKFQGHRISQNGGVVYDDKNTLVHRSRLSKESLNAIIDAVEGLPVLVFVQTEDTYYTPKRLPIIEAFEKKQPYLKYVEKTDILETMHELEVVTISLWAEKDENLKISKALEKQLPNDTTHYVSSAYTIDITSRANSKGSAIEMLADRNRIAYDDLYIIGDSYNDISMFKLTKNSYVMDIADEAVKRHANHPVKSVEEAINHILNH